MISKGKAFFVVLLALFFSGISILTIDCTKNENIDVIFTEDYYKIIKEITYASEKMKTLDNGLIQMDNYVGIKDDKGIWSFEQYESQTVFKKTKNGWDYRVEDIDGNVGVKKQGEKFYNLGLNGWVLSFKGDKYSQPYAFERLKFNCSKKISENIDRIRIHRKIKETEYSLILNTYKNNKSRINYVIDNKGFLVEITCYREINSHNLLKTTTQLLKYNSEEIMI
ncbi:hypothetical protein [Anaerovorax odorimutans]|uniref:hypothetical protein n=1 Tax=Anaerovorax odorimutans TaxID=109327 RepID=UPI00040433F5|nr:hypothetical protein [Anaerovorax odorimutans]